MSKQNLTDMQVEKEIERLQKSPFVKLAKKEERIKYKRRQYLYCLRCYEKKGAEMQRSGITIEILEQMNKNCDDDK